MSAVEFQGLCDAICRQAGIQAAAVQDYGDGTVALQLQFGDVNVMLAQYAANPSLVMALVNFGEPEPHEELACWLSLLDVNYHLLGAWPTSLGAAWAPVRRCCSVPFRWGGSPLPTCTWVWCR